MFFFVWAALQDGIDDTALTVGAISGISLAVVMVLFREIVFRRTRERDHASRRLSYHLQEAKRLLPPPASEDKLSIRQNDRLLAEIRTKSDVAKVLGQLAEAHQEVFELCDRYLALASTELLAARAGSPRIPALRKGAAAASKRHRYHMLQWAQLKSRSFTEIGSESAHRPEKILAAEEALNAVEKASTVYPGETALADSRRVLRVYLISARVRDAIFSAERADASGNYAESLNHYADALARLQKFDVAFEERPLVEKRIRTEIDRLRRLTEAGE